MAERLPAYPMQSPRLHPKCLEPGLGMEESGDGGQEMAQRTDILAIKSDHMNLITKSHKVEGKNQLLHYEPQFVHTHAHSPHTHQQ